MFHDTIFLILGLVLLILGANYVTDGAVAVAKRFNVSNLIIGLTVVALGSTLPVPLLSKRKEINRPLGALLVILYVPYMVFAVIRG
ncbi:MAG: hypothetical protein K2G69_00050 [Muribaculaceae bacterium]|nr:hypothetical protein [Muribaculaceae bacterium]